MTFLCEGCTGNTKSNAENYELFPNWNILLFFMPENYRCNFNISFFKLCSQTIPCCCCKGWIKMGSATCQLDFVWFGKRYVHTWFEICPSNMCIRFRREVGTQNQNQNITEQDAFLGRSIMVCAENSLGYRTDRNIFRRSSMAVRYKDEVQDTTERLYAAAVVQAFLLMVDNARHHRAVLIEAYMVSDRFARMEWPA